jgi:hypothetical protein
VASLIPMPSCRRVREYTNKVPQFSSHISANAHEVLQHFLTAVPEPPRVWHVKPPQARSTRRVGCHALPRPASKVMRMPFDDFTSSTGPTTALAWLVQIPPYQRRACRPSDHRLILIGHAIAPAQAMQSASATTMGPAIADGRAGCWQRERVVRPRFSSSCAAVSAARSSQPQERPRRSPSLLIST